MYTDKYFSRLSAPVELTLTSNANVAGNLALENGKVRQIAITVSTLMSSSGATVVTFYVRNALGVTSGQVSLGTISIPNATAVGKTIYKNITPVAITKGQTLEADVTTAATSAGKGLASVQIDYDPETEANLPNWIASA